MTMSKCFLVSTAQRISTPHIITLLEDLEGEKKLGRVNQLAHMRVALLKGSSKAISEA